MAKKSSTFTCVIQAAKISALKRQRESIPIQPATYFKTKRLSLQYPIHDVQLPIAACCHTKVVRDDKESFISIACEI